jgi:glycosyltransferase involved in cell wall biosynthesis
LSRKAVNQLTAKELRLHVLIDYRPALRQRTGVGEYVHELAAALVKTAVGDAITLFSSSWKDRLAEDAVAGAAGIDRRIPVTVLNFAWHRLRWPSVETVAGGHYDVVMSGHPLPMPTRHAARIVTVHDLDFLDHPERTHREIRRDYPALVPAAVKRADHILVNSMHTGREVERRLGVERSHITVCSPGAPDWAPRHEEPPDAYLLFFGTLEPRKNIQLLLEAYARFVAGRTAAPRLVLAGGVEPAADAMLTALPAPVRRQIDVLGYVSPDRRLDLYRGALMLVIPSHTEGFGIPALEAMTVGVPVVASDRGALPEVVGDAGVLIDPRDSSDLAKRISELADNPGMRDRLREAGWRQSRRFDWNLSAARARDAWHQALERRRRRG